MSEQEPLVPSDKPRRIIEGLDEIDTESITTRILDHLEGNLESLDSYLVTSSWRPEVITQLRLRLEEEIKHVKDDVAAGISEEALVARYNAIINELDDIARNSLSSK